MRVPKPSPAPLAALTVREQSATQTSALFTTPHASIGYKRRVNFKLEYGAPRDGSEFFCINPMRAHQPREMTLSNLDIVTNFLIEADRGTLLAQEREYEKQLRLPFTTKVYSGGKSIHYITRFTKPVTLDDYAIIATIVKHVVKSADPSLKNPNRLSRLAGIVRHDTGRQQQLLGIGPQISLEAFIEALKAAAPMRYNAALAEMELDRMRRDRARLDGEAERYKERRRWTPEQHLDFSERRATEEPNRHTAILNCGVRMLHDGHPIEEIELTTSQLCVRLGLDTVRTVAEVEGVIRWLERRVSPEL